MNEALSHPHFIERGMITQAIDNNGHEIAQINSPLPFKRQIPHHVAGTLGSNTHQVLSTLGYSNEKIADLEKNHCL